MTGRVTRPPDPDELPSLKQRNPLAWWVAVLCVVGLIASTATGLIAALLS